MSDLYTSSQIVSNKNEDIEINRTNKIEYNSVSQQNTSTNTSNVEEVDLSLNDNQDNTSSLLSAEEYQNYIQEQGKSINKYIETIQESLNKLNQEKDELETKELDSSDGEALLFFVENYENNINQLKSEINKVVSDYAINGINISKLGVTYEEYLNLSYEEQEKLVLQYDEHAKNLEEAIKMNEETINNYTKEKTGYDTYDEFKAYQEELEQNIAILEAGLKSLETQKQQLPYNSLKLSEDYQNYQSKQINSDNFNISLYKYYDSLGLSYNYNLYKGEASPLEFVRQIQESTAGANIKITGVTHVEELKQMLELEKENPDLTKTYNYLYETKGIDAANDYVDSLISGLNQIEGQKKAEEFLSGLKTDENGNYNQADIINHLKTTGKGFGDGVESFFEGIHNIFSADGALSTEDYESLYILEALAEKGGFLHTNYEISKTIGNTTPSVILGLLTNPMIGSVSMGLSAGGNAYESALVEGYSNPQAILYGVLTGGSEALTEKILGGINGLSDVQITGVKTLLKSMGKEGIQEGFQEVLDSAFRSAVFGEEINLEDLIKQFGKSTVYGVITSGFFNGAGLSVNITKKSIQELSTVEDFSTKKLTENLNINEEQYNTIVNSQNVDLNSVIAAATNQDFSLMANQLGIDNITSLTDKVISESQIPLELNIEINGETYYYFGSEVEGSTDIAGGMKHIREDIEKTYTLTYGIKEDAAKEFFRNTLNDEKSASEITSNMKLSTFKKKLRKSIDAQQKAGNTKVDISQLEEILSELTYVSDKKVNEKALEETFTAAGLEDVYQELKDQNFNVDEETLKSLQAYASLQAKVKALNMYANKDLYDKSITKGSNVKLQGIPTWIELEGKDNPYYVEIITRKADPSRGEKGDYAVPHVLSLSKAKPITVEESVKKQSSRAVKTTLLGRKDQITSKYTGIEYLQDVVSLPSTKEEYVNLSSDEQNKIIDQLMEKAVASANDQMSSPTSQSKIEDENYLRMAQEQIENMSKNEDLKNLVNQYIIESYNPESSDFEKITKEINGFL